MKWNMDIVNGYTPTDAELELNRFYMSECERLGIDVRSFNESDSIYTKEELQAIALLSKGKKLSYKLEQHLLATKSERLRKRGVRTTDTSFYTPEMESEFEDLYG